MLTVADLFRKLSYGQLSNLSLANQGNGTIAQPQENKIINALNEGLLRIYSRFALLEREVLIEQYDHITNYHMDKRFAVNNPEREPNHFPYILDLPNEPFNNDVIKILAVHDSTGTPLTLNSENGQNSIFTPYPTVLQIPNPAAEIIFNVVYQAAHPRLEFGVKETEVRVPQVLENALLSHVAYQIYSGMNTQESVAIAAGHLSMYDMICTEVEEQGHATIHGQSNVHKFNRKGWV